MTLQATVGGVSVNAQTVVGQKGLTAAAAGPDGSFGNVLFDDIAGTLAIQGWRFTKVEENECSQPRLFTGWVADRTYSDGLESGTAGRIIDTTLVDQNAVFAFRLITGTDGKRPAETHNERIDWLLGSSYLSGLIADYGAVDQSHPRPFEDSDYRGQYAMDVLNDLAGPIFKTFFAYWDASNNGIGLFFAAPTVTTSTCTLSISNVNGASDDLTIFAPQNAQMVADPSEVTSLVRYKYRNGLVIERDATTKSTFFDGQAPDGGNLGDRGIQVDNDRIGIESSARIMADGILERRSEETEVITCVITVPASKVGLIDAGMRILCTFTHLGITAEYLRITRRTIRQTNEANSGFYDVELEMSNSGLPGTGGGGSPGDFPNPPAAGATIVQWKHADLPAAGVNTITFDAAPAEGNYLWVGASRRGGVPGLAPAFTASPDGTFGPTGFYVDGGASGYRIVGSGESAAIAVRASGHNGIEESFTLVEIAGVGAPDANSEGLRSWGTYPAATSFSAGTLTPPAGETGIAMMLGSVGCSDFASNGATTVTAAAPWTELVDEADGNGPGFHPIHFVAYRAIQSASGSYSTAQLLNGGPYNYGGDGGQTLFFPTSAESDNVPEPGRWVYDERPTPTPGGGVRTFFTAFPFADGSLIVKVDNINETAAITSYDGAAGGFTLGFDPRSWETVLVTYQGR